MAALKKLIPLIAISVIPTLLIWFPFFLRSETFWGIPLPKEGMATIVANYDGPLYIVVAKSLYSQEIIGNFSFNLPSIYYTAHFPLYPFLIKMFAGIFGFPYSMLFVTACTSVLALYFFYKLIKEYVDKKDVYWITLLFSLFPARWLIVRSVGSAEPLFIASVIAFFYYFKKGKYLFALIWGIIAQLTKSPAILIFISCFLAISVPKLTKAATTTFSKWFSRADLKRYLTVFATPLTLLGVFIFYKIRVGDFFAYFHSGDNIHLFFPPFQIFNYSQPWVGTFWLEEILFIYLFGILGVLKLVKMKEYNFAWFAGVFFASILFVSHRDLIRYSLPIVPFLYIAFADTVIKKEFKIAALVLAVPIYLFSLAYISQNVMPISNWAPLL